MLTQEINEVNSVIVQNKHLTYAEISKLLESQYDVTLSPEAIRKRLSRMKTKLQQEAAELGVELSEVSKIWCKSKSATFEVQKKPDLTKLHQDIKEIFKALDTNRPKIKREKIKDGHLMVIDPADMHFGKLGRISEVGEDYDLDVAKSRLEEGLSGLLNKAAGFNIEKFLIITGNDVVHADNPRNTTTSGTYQDCCAMWWESYKTAQASLKSVLDTLLDVADVDVMFCPSNHDFMSGFMLVDSIAEYYAHNPNIKFDSNMRHRKYYKYGKSLICGSHGDGMKMADMPLIMAQESGMWDSTEFRYCYLHHIHNYKKQNWRSGEDFVGTTVEYLRSLTGMDRWTSTNFGRNVKALEGFIHHPSQGQIAKISHYF